MALTLFCDHCRRPFDRLVFRVWADDRMLLDLCEECVPSDARTFVITPIDLHQEQLKEEEHGL